MVNTFPMMITKMAMNAMARVGFNMILPFWFNLISSFDFKDCQGISCNVVVLHTSKKFWQLVGIVIVKSKFSTHCKQGSKSNLHLHVF